MQSLPLPAPHGEGLQVARTPGRTKGSASGPGLIASSAALCWTDRKSCPRATSGLTRQDIRVLGGGVVVFGAGSGEKRRRPTPRTNEKARARNVQGNGRCFNRSAVSTTRAQQTKAGPAPQRRKRKTPNRAYFKHSALFCPCRPPLQLLRHSLALWAGLAKTGQHCSQAWTRRKGEGVGVHSPAPEARKSLGRRWQGGGLFLRVRVCGPGILSASSGLLWSRPRLCDSASSVLPTSNQHGGLAPTAPNAERGPLA